MMAVAEARTAAEAAAAAEAEANAGNVERLKRAVAKGKAVDAERRTIEAALAEAQRVAQAARDEAALLQVAQEQSAELAQQAREQAAALSSRLAAAEAEGEAHRESSEALRLELSAVQAAAATALTTPWSSRRRTSAAGDRAAAPDLEAAGGEAFDGGRAWRGWRDSAARSGRLGAMLARSPARLSRSLDAADRALDGMIRALRANPSARVAAVAYVMVIQFLLLSLLLPAAHGVAAAATVVEAVTAGALPLS